jgi:hypothetical protein
LIMVKAKMMAKIRQRTLLALAVPACAFAAAGGWIPAAGRFREALERAMVRTSFYYCCERNDAFPGGVVSTIEGSLITV